MAVDAGSADKNDKSEREKLLAEAARVRRPVALLALIDKLDHLDVNEDLILGVLEAAEGGIDLDTLFNTPITEVVEQTEEEEEAPPPPVESVRPIPVYRLGEGVRLYFAADNVPVGPPIHHVYSSRLQYKQCFACELRGDEMVGESYPAFKQGNILIFTADARVESGDFVFVKTRNTDEFTQIFFGQEDQVRLRMLNPLYPERVMRRFELKVLCKLVARLEEF